MIPSNRLKQRKRALRREMLVRRDAMPQPDRAERSGRIAERLLALPELGEARTVMAFSSFGSEVDTRPILDGLLARGVRLCLPRISGSEIEAVAYRPGDEVTTARFGALEPAAGPALADTELDAVVTPGVVFDRRGFRVGYGGGYYDRLFRRIRPDAFRVAIGFQVQAVEAVPRGTTDLPVDALVTEDGVTRFPRG